MLFRSDPVKVGQRIGMTFDPDDIQIMRKSDFSPDLKKPVQDDAEQVLNEDV